MNWSDFERRAFPFAEWDQPGDEPERARWLTVDQCPIEHARTLVSRWHSRLPRTQKGPWQRAFRLHYGGFSYGVALMHNPSARTLPAHWVELRRMAIAPDAPHCAASRFLAGIVHWYRVNEPERERIISYQDEAVHLGTIYRAAGWQAVARSAPRERQRAGYSRPGSRREYRTALNGPIPDISAKIRWEFAWSEK